MSTTSQTIDATNDGCEWIFQAREAATITHLGFRLTSKTGTSPNFKISLQALTSSMVPDGTPLGGASPASAVFTFTGLTAGEFCWIDLDNDYTCTRGQFMAIVIAYDSGTIGASDFMSVAISHDTFGGRRSFPIATAITAGSRSKNSLSPIWGYKTASRVYGEPTKAYTETQFSSDSTPDEWALSFTIPAGFSDTMKVGGIRINGRTSATGKSLVVNLYSGTTVLQTVTFDTDAFQGGGSGFRAMEFIFTDATLTALTVGSTYRIGFQPADTGHNFAITVIEFTDAADLDAMPGGTDFLLSTRTNAAGWDADSTTKRPIAEFIIDDMTEPAGGGGGGTVGHGLTRSLLVGR